MAIIRECSSRPGETIRHINEHGDILAVQEPMFGPDGKISAHLKFITGADTHSAMSEAYQKARRVPVHTSSEAFSKKGYSPFPLQRRGKRLSERERQELNSENLRIVAGYRWLLESVDWDTVIPNYSKVGRLQRIWNTLSVSVHSVGNLIQETGKRAKDNMTTVKKRFYLKKSEENWEEKMRTRFDNRFYKHFSEATELAILARINAPARVIRQAQTDRQEWRAQQLSARFARRISFATQSIGKQMRGTFHTLSMPFLIKMVEPQLEKPLFMPQQIDTTPSMTSLMQHLTMIEDSERSSGLKGYSTAYGWRPF